MSRITLKCLCNLRREGKFIRFEGKAPFTNRTRARDTAKGHCATDKGLLAYKVVMDFFMKQIFDIAAKS